MTLSREKSSILKLVSPNQKVALQNKTSGVVAMTTATKNLISVHIARINIDEFLEFAARKTRI